MTTSHIFTIPATLFKIPNYLSKYQINCSKYETHLTCDKWRRHIFSQLQTANSLNARYTLALSLCDKWHDKFQPPMLTKMNPLSHSLILIGYDWSWHMTKKSQDFILPVSNTLALPFPILFLKGQIDEDKDRVENPKNFDWPWCNWWNWWCFWSVLKSDHAMQLVKLVCFKVWPCYASEVGDVFWLLWHQGDRVSQSSGHCFCLEVLTLSETIINNDH